MKLKANVEVEYLGENKMFLHKGLGEGQIEDGRKARLIMTNAGVVMQVTDKKDRNKWRSFSVTWDKLSRAIAEAVPKIEEKIKDGKE